MTDRRAQWREGVVYLGAWSVLAALYTSAIIVQNGLSLPMAIVAAIFSSAVPGVLGFVIWRVSPAMNDPRHPIAVRIGWHVLAALLFAALSVGMDFLQLRHVNQIPPRFLLRTILPWQTISALLLYCAIAGVSWAVHSARRSRELALAAARAEQMRAQAELAALRAHINPHFLFNALHAVTQLLHTHPDRAAAAVERLAALFRYVLRLDRDQVQLVALEEEWQFAQDYLFLETLRLGDRLRVEASLDDDALLCAVPPFTLQPLLENAIKHGLSRNPAGGTLRIIAREDETGLQLEVVDTGSGDAAAARDERVSTGGVAAGAPAPSGAGLGLRSVRQRLAARHGDRAMVAAGPRAEGGYAVRLTIPAESAP